MTKAEWHALGVKASSVLPQRDTISYEQFQSLLSGKNKRTSQQASEPGARQQPPPRPWLPVQESDQSALSQQASERSVEQFDIGTPRQSPSAFNPQSPGPDESEALALEAQLAEVRARIQASKTVSYTHLTLPTNREV